MSKCFDEIFEAIPTVIDFDPSWKSTIGNFDGAVKGKAAPSLKSGEIVKTFSRAPYERKIILIGTPFGNVVLFERFVGGKFGTITQNCPDEIIQLFGWSGLPDENQIDFILGDVFGGVPENNIGHRLANWRCLSSTHSTDLKNIQQEDNYAY